jgi:hypothetical protein
MSKEGILGSTLADEMDYKAMQSEKNPQALERLKNELADWQNPDYYKGFTQAERDKRIAGLKRLIAAYEEPKGYDHDSFGTEHGRKGSI